MIKPIVNFRTIISTDLQRKERRDIIKDLTLETRRARIFLQVQHQAVIVKLKAENLVIIVLSSQVQSRVTDRLRRIPLRVE